MNSLIVFSLLLVGSLAAPQFLQPLTLQAAQPTAVISSPTFLTAPQLFAQPALFSQPALQQEEVQQEAQPAVAEQASLRDPNNPSTDILLHSGFPFVSSFQTGGVQSPFAFSATPLTRVNINSVLPQQTAQIQQQPAAAPLVAQPQAQTFALPSLTTAAAAAPATAQLPATPLILTPFQSAAQFRTVSPFTLAGPFTVAAQ